MINRLPAKRENVLDGEVLPPEPEGVYKWPVYAATVRPENHFTWHFVSEPEPTWKKWRRKSLVVIAFLCVISVWSIGVMILLELVGLGSVTPLHFLFGMPGGLLAGEIAAKVSHD